MYMKKLFTLLMALAATLSMSATTLFFHPNENWRKDNARFAVYNVETQKWADLAPVQGEKNIFSAVVEEYTTKVIFYRMDPAKKENTLANKWNETNELTLELNKNLYIMDEGAWDKGGGYWSRFEATPAEGSLYLWNGIGSTFKATEKGGDSFVLKTDERVLIGAGMMGNSCLKINGDYTNGYYIGIVLKEGGVNAGDTICLGDFRTDNSGTYRFGIEFFANVDATTPQGKFLTTTDPQVLNQEGAPKQAIYIVPNGINNATHLRLFRNSGNECIWIAKLELIKKGSAPDPGPGPEPQPEDPKIQFAGELTSWSPVDFTLAADKKTATFTKNIAEGEHQFKIIVNGDWRSNAQSFDRDNASAAGITGNESTNMKLIADATGDYTFTWTIATNALEINFPAKEGPGPEPQPEDPKVQFAGEITGWSGEAFTLAADKKTATFTKNIAEGEHEFKIIVGDNDWRSNGWTFHREFTHADGITMNDGANMKLQADTTGDYTFTWTFETNSLDILFPAKEGPEPPVDELVDGFYLVGTINEWTPSAPYLFAHNLGAEAEEYALEIDLKENDGLKVVKVENKAVVTWYPEGMGNEYVVDADHAGKKTVYFRPAYVEEWAAFGGFIFIPANGGEGLNDLNASEKAIKVIRNGQIIILKGDKAFNILGSQID